MTDQIGRPLHMRDTGAFPTAPLQEALRQAQLKKQREAGREGPPVGPKPVNPNAAANGSNTFVWPTEAADPTRRVQALQPVVPPAPLPPPNVTVEPPMSAKDALTLRAACLVTAGVVSLIAAVWAVVSVFAP